MVPSATNSQIQYETTLFEPSLGAKSDTPVVIINHGTNSAQPQSRYRPLIPVQFFTGLGYSIVVPNRRGYGKSTGKQVKIKNCDLTAYGMDNALDIADVMVWVKNQDRYRGRKLIVIGQSTGGLATMAYSARADSAVAAIINFHGGIRPSSPTDCKWQARIEAFDAYAPTSHPYSLWIYTANDHSSNPAYIAKLYQSFAAAGGTSQLLQLPAFKTDGHYLFTDPDGLSIWGPLVSHYLQELKISATQNQQK